MKGLLLNPNAIEDYLTKLNNKELEKYQQHIYVTLRERDLKKQEQKQAKQTAAKLPSYGS